MTRQKSASKPTCSPASSTTEKPARSSRTPQLHDVVGLITVSSSDSPVCTSSAGVGRRAGRRRPVVGGRRVSPVATLSAPAAASGGRSGERRLGRRRHRRRRRRRSTHRRPGRSPPSGARVRMNERRMEPPRYRVVSCPLRSDLNRGTRRRVGDRRRAASDSRRSSAAVTAYAVPSVRLASTTMPTQPAVVVDERRAARPGGDRRAERVHLALVAGAGRWCRATTSGPVRTIVDGRGRRRACATAPRPASSVARSTAGPSTSARSRARSVRAIERRRRAAGRPSTVIAPPGPSTVWAAVATRPSPTTTPTPRSRCRAIARLARRPPRRRRRGVAGPSSPHPASERRARSGRRRGGVGAEQAGDALGDPAGRRQVEELVGAVGVAAGDEGAGDDELGVGEAARRACP